MSICVVSSMFMRNVMVTSASIRYFPSKVDTYAFVLNGECLPSPCECHERKRAKREHAFLTLLSVETSSLMDPENVPLAVTKSTRTHARTAM